MNVHCIQVEQPSLLGNISGVGVILRDLNGTKVWAALGPLHDMDDMQASIWVTHAETIEAWK